MTEQEEKAFIAKFEADLKNSKLSEIAKKEMIKRQLLKEKEKANTIAIRGL